MSTKALRNKSCSSFRYMRHAARGIALAFCLFGADTALAVGRDAPVPPGSACHAVSSADAAVTVASLARLGLALLDGACGGDPDPARAIPLLEAAATRGHAEAAWRLALYLDGHAATDTQQARALHFYRVAAHAGHVGAQHRLGLLLVAEGTDRATQAEGLDWLRRAADQGDGVAAAALAVIRGRGLHGVAQDACQALRWIARSRQLGAPVDLAALAVALSARTDGTC